MLVDREHRLVRLFTPPFDKTAREPGYIKGYLPGVRENGGQYTHGAVWLAMALTEAGMLDEGYEALSMMLPENHDSAVYRAEPYVLAADVCSEGKYAGLAGWSWYTGAAGWYYRAAAEGLLGIRIERDRLYVEPRLPSGWDGFMAVWQGHGGPVEITVRVTGESAFIVDGEPRPEGYLALDGKKHVVERRI